MKFTPDTCPECGERPASEVNTIQSLCGLRRHEDGTYEHDGDTKICWDTAEPVRGETGHVLLQCQRYHEWWATCKETP